MVNLKENQQVPLKEKVSYGMTSFGLSAISGVLSSFALYYFTDVALLAPAAVTWLLFMVRFFDGAIDPFIGHYMDGHRTRLGKYKGYLIYWSLPFCLLSILVFLPVPLSSEVGKLAWYVLVYLTWSFCYSIIESANLPLLAVMTNDPKQRYSVNSAKIIGGILATLVARYVALNLVDLLGGGQEVKGYALTAILLAVVGFVFIQFPARKIVERNEQTSTPPNIWKAAVLLLKDRRIVFMLLFYFSHQMASSVKGQAAIYYMKYIVNQQELTAVFLVIGTLSSLAMQPLIILCAKKISTHILIIAGYIGGAAGMFVMGSADASVTQLFAGNILYGITVAFPANLLYVYVAELADSQKTSSNAMLHSMLGLVFRFALAISGSLIAIVLNVSDYIPNIAQSADSQSGIKFAFITITFILYLLAALFAMISFRHNSRKKGALV